MLGVKHCIIPYKWSGYGRLGSAAADAIVTDRLFWLLGCVCVMAFLALLRLTVVTLIFFQYFIYLSIWCQHSSSWKPTNYQWCHRIDHTLECRIHICVLQDWFECWIIIASHLYVQVTLHGISSSSYFLLFMSSGLKLYGNNFCIVLSITFGKNVMWWRKINLDRFNWNFSNRKMALMKSLWAILRAFPSQ